MNTKFNTNDYVWIKINEEGYVYLAKKHKDFYEEFGLNDTSPEMGTPVYYKAKANEEGYTKMQMHVFLANLGSTTGMGRRQLYETNIRFDSKDLEEITYDE